MQRLPKQIQIMDYASCVGRKSIQLMKRSFQFVVFALVLLAAAQPLLADIACDQRQCEGSPVCSVWFEGMAIPDSAMLSLLASAQATPYAVLPEAGCSNGWCWLASDSPRLLVATPQTFRQARGSTFMPVAQLSANSAVVLAARSSEDATAGAVPRNILFQVFRI